MAVLPLSQDVETGDTLDHEGPVEVTSAELPLHCPTAGISLWNAHPRVYLPIEQHGEALCPYCGTRYRLKEPARPAH